MRLVDMGITAIGGQFTLTITHPSMEIRELFVTNLGHINFSLLSALNEHSGSIIFNHAISFA